MFFRVKKGHRFSCCLLLIACFLIGYLIFSRKTFGPVSIDQLLFHLLNPLKQADVRLFYKGIGYGIVLPLLMFYVLWRPSFFLPRQSKVRRIFLTYENNPRFVGLFSALFFVFTVVGFIHALKLPQWWQNVHNPSLLYETHFVEPAQAGISFGQKKNIVLIYLESIENTYFNNSVFEENALPALSALREKNISFSGFRQLDGTQWSMAGVFSGLCGAPLKVPLKGVRMDLFETFLPGITCVPEVLKNNGYRNYFLLGSAASFSGMDNFFKQHGFDTYWGRAEIHRELLPQGITKEMTGTGWGLNDHELFKIARRKITEVAAREGPFLFAMATIDTHFPNGYFNPQTCEKKSGNFLDVVRCSDREVSRFVTWLRAQPFADETVIVLLGDHITMGNDVYDQIVMNPNREILNVFIDPQRSEPLTKHRVFSSMDLAPTILALSGAHLEKNAFGLGRNLLTETPTLLEEMGDEFVRQLNRFSKYYGHFFKEKQKK